MIKIHPLLFLALFSGGLLSLATARQASSFTVGSVRVQLLFGSLVRLEAQGPAGFEDRGTFHIVNRDWPGTTFSAQTNAGIVEIRTKNYLVRVPQNAAAVLVRCL